MVTFQVLSKAIVFLGIHTIKQALINSNVMPDVKILTSFGSVHNPFSLS